MEAGGSEGVGVHSMQPHEVRKVKEAGIVPRVATAISKPSEPANIRGMVSGQLHSFSTERALSKRESAASSVHDCKRAHQSVNAEFGEDAAKGAHAEAPAGLRRRYSSQSPLNTHRWPSLIARSWQSAWAMLCIESPW